jgi:hypothetical protein
MSTNSLGGKHTIPGPTYQPEKPPSLLSLSLHRNPAINTGSREASADIYIATSLLLGLPWHKDLWITFLISFLYAAKKVGEKSCTAWWA